MAKNILIVDDALFMRMRLKEIITRNGYNVIGEAENGQKAFEMYKELRPDMVMMDITMPVVDGIGAVKLIREEDPKAKIVMCSAMGQRAMVMDALYAGAFDFIVKPFQPDRVIDAIKKAIG